MFGLFHIWEIPAVILAVGAFHIYKAWNRWWIAHPRLNNGYASSIPGTVVLFAWVLAMFPFWFWGMPGIGKWVFLLCFVPMALVGAFHMFLFIKPAVDKMDSATDAFKRDGDKK